MGNRLIAEEEKKRIFEVTIKLLESVGYENLTIRRICEETGISIGKFYRYFNNKQELLSYYFYGAIETFQEEIDERIKGLPLMEQIIEFYRWYTDYTANFGLDFVTHFFSNTNESLDVSKYNNAVIATTDRLLEEAIQDGYQIPGKATIHDTSIDICVIVKGAIFHWCVQKGGFDLSAYTVKLLRKTLTSIL